MTPGLVSTIIPVYNRELMLRAAVESVMAQSWRQLEVLIVDDGSTDATGEIARSLAEAHPGVVFALRQSNAGPGLARNLGLQSARGEFIQYLDSDDLLEPRKFELQVAALRAHPEAGVAYGLTMRTNLDTGASRVWAGTGQPIANIFPDFLMKRAWDTNSPLWRRSVCDAIGPWSDFRCMEDWEHDLRAGLLGVLPVRVQEHVATVRDHSAARASGMQTGFTPALTRDFFRAHGAIWQLMRERGLTDWSYLEQFSRKLFWIARMCGERGLIAEAEEALTIAERMARTHRLPGDMRLFRGLVRILGWPRTVAVSEGLRGLIRRNAESSFA